MIWYLPAFDENADHPKQWCVLRFDGMGTPGTIAHHSVFSRWPTLHEAESHARKALGRHGK